MKEGLSLPGFLSLPATPGPPKQSPAQTRGSASSGLVLSLSCEAFLGLLALLWGMLKPAEFNHFAPLPRRAEHQSPDLAQCHTLAPQKHTEKSSSHVPLVTIRAQRVSSVCQLMVGTASGGEHWALLAEHPSQGVTGVPCLHQTLTSADSTTVAVTTSAGTRWAASSAAARRATSCS